MIRKVVIIGPESTGKSTLSELLAKHYQTVWVPEYAREYIENLQRPYNEADLLEIAKGQLMLEDKLTTEANKLLICDTDLYVLKIWSEHKYGHCHPWILEQIRNRTYHLYLLTYIDIAWVEDPQREHPQMREYFFNLYQDELTNAHKNFVVIKGSFEQRLEIAISAIDTFLIE